MSQKKMEAYKEAKKNKRQIEKQQKRKRILNWILGIIIAAALIGGSVYLVYYSSVILPKQQEAELEAQQNADTDMDATTTQEINVGEDGAVLDGTDQDNMMVVPEDATTDAQQPTE